MEFLWHEFTAVAILIHFCRDFRAQSSDFFILLRSYVWYFANSSCALNRFGSGEWQFYYLASRYLVRVSIPLYSKNFSPQKQCKHNTLVHCHSGQRVNRKQSATSIIFFRWVPPIGGHVVELEVYARTRACSSWPRMRRRFTKSSNEQSWRSFER